MSLIAITVVHVAVSLVALGAGFVLLQGLRKGERRAERLFLSTTIATSLTGYLFPTTQLLPSHVVGAISLALLGLAVSTRESNRRSFIIASMSAYYLNLLVLFVQIFKRVEPLSSLEGPAQLLLLTWFIITTYQLTHQRKGLVTA